MVKRIALLLLLVGCKGDKTEEELQTGFLLAFQADESLADDVITSVRKIHLEVDGDAQAFEHDFEVAKGDWADREVTASYGPYGESGELTFRGRALDADGAVVGSGEESATIDPGRIVDVVIALHAGGGREDGEVVIAKDGGVQPDTGLSPDAAADGPADGAPADAPVAATDGV
ncbi:MAG: hypothetical protein AABZ30_03785, partial [Myxococcota bacterium]